VLGFPIRTSPDQRLVGDSPRLNAASHVLHRLLMPRHPPCALKNLATKMLASTMQISNNKQPPPPTPRNPGMLRRPCTEDSQTGRPSHPGPPQRPGGSAVSVPSGPNSVSEPRDPPAGRSHSLTGGTRPEDDHRDPSSQCSTSELSPHHTLGGDG
jgi:hypothetical protein